MPEVEVSLGMESEVAMWQVVYALVLRERWV
jgi:hypothetical protein